MSKPKPSYSKTETIGFPFVPLREVEEIYALLEQAADNADPKGEVEISDSSSIYESISEVADRTWKPETLELSLTGSGRLPSTLRVYISRTFASIGGGGTDEHRALAAQIAKIIERRTPGTFVQNFRIVAPILAAALTFVVALAAALAAAFHRLDLPSWPFIVVASLGWMLLLFLYPFGNVRLFKSGAWLRPLVDEQQGWIRIRERVFVSLVSGAVGFVLGWLVRSLPSE